MIDQFVDANKMVPITPPPELVQQWFRDCPLKDPFNREFYVVVQAARWGADQELEACVEWLRNDGLFETRIGHLRAARRPKPPSLKEQALQALEEERVDMSLVNYKTIKSILEQLDE